MGKGEHYDAWLSHAHLIPAVSHISKALFHPKIGQKGGGRASIPGFSCLGLSFHLLGPQIGEATDTSDPCLLPAVGRSCFLL